MVSGFALAQNNPYAGDINSRWDLSNAQLVVQKTDGLVQFYVQAGQYDVPALATPTVSSSTYTNHAFGFVPQAFLKLAPTDNFSIEVGKLPTLIGDENTFSFQNPNIERGLGWNQTNGQTRGVQANYTIGPVLLNLSWSDGYYSDRFNWISGMATWTIDSANTLGLVGAGNAGKTPASTFITPLFQNNQQIYDLIYTRTQGAWMLQPYVQVSQVPEDRAIGIDSSGSTWAAAFLVNYNIAPNWNLAGRIEYIGTSGGLNLLEGPAEQRVVAHRHADLPVQDLLYAGGSVLCRRRSRDAGRHDIRRIRYEIQSVPRASRDRRSVLTGKIDLQRRASGHALVKPILCFAFPGKHLCLNNPMLRCR
jgi:hypothetical protein